MKKTLLSVFTVLGLATFSVAQGDIEIYVNGGSTDVSGSTVYLSPEGPGDVVADIHFENLTGGTLNWYVTRARINEQATWSDFLCWGHETDQFGGTCYTAALMPTNPWTSANHFDVANGEAGVCAAHINPDENTPATVTYRYYVHENGQPYADSVDIEVSFSATVEAAQEINVSVGPNPASEYITISAGGVENPTVQIVDVLGNVVFKKSMGTYKKIDISDFRNGIYFIRVEAPGVKTLSKKIIVRH